MQVEEAYKEFTTDLSKWAHDGIISIDLSFLHDQGLLAGIQEDSIDPDDLTQYFHVIESVEKVTLFNEQFVVWIVPQMESEIPSTLVLVAMLQREKPHLEIVFRASGVYNTPRYVLRVLQFFLLDMIETQATLSAIEKKGSG